MSQNWVEAVVAHFMVVLNVAEIHTWEPLVLTLCEIKEFHPNP